MCREDVEEESLKRHDGSNLGLIPFAMVSVSCIVLPGFESF